ncbi:MAG: hypothetical protein NTU44_14400 [Bacteroidetes bacterium]|nr:hypothetical protein [Bacteroidota bacterium]
MLLPNITNGQKSSNRIFSSILSLCVILMVVFPFRASASHFMGGEIWWECLANGKYVFHIRAYQMCSFYAWAKHS